MRLNPNSVACAMRTKHNGVQGRRARSARYIECANVVCFDSASVTDTASASPAPPSPGEQSPSASLSQFLQPLLGPCRMLLVLDGRRRPFRSRRSRLGRRAYTGLRLRNGRPRYRMLLWWLVHFSSLFCA
jgi:hypothetical protein